MKAKLSLLLIIILAAFLRLYHLGSLPPSLNWDEISHGYNAYSILKTGRDQWGQLLPLINFRAYGDYPLPLNLYLTIPFIAILGLNAFAIRLPHALLGLGTILATCFLTKEFFPNSSSDQKVPPKQGRIAKKLKSYHLIPLLSSFLVAISPWFILPSRQVAQSNLSVFFLTTGLALFFNRHRHSSFLPLSFLSLGLTLFAYHSTRILTPLLLLTLLFFHRKPLLSRIKKLPASSAVSILILVVFFLPLPFILLNPRAQARSDWVFLINQGAVNHIIEHRLSSGLPSPLPRLLYNRPVYFAQEFTKNYLGYFSPQFLFFQGGTQYQFSLPHHGLLYPVNLPFFYIGLALLIIKARKNRGHSRFLLTWLLLAPLPAAITQEKFAVLRSSTLLPLPQILTAWGAVYAYQALSQHTYLHRLRLRLRLLLPAVYFTTLLISLTTYYLKLTTDYPKDYSWAWQHGYRQAVQYAKDHYQEYDQIIFTKKYGEPHEFILFYWPWDPLKYQTDPKKVWDYHANWYWVDTFDKFRFVNDWEVKDPPLLNPKKLKSQQAKKLLLITSPNNTPPNATLLETIPFLDGSPAFEIYSVTN